ncbi:TetR family transcriptional regulator [[Actinomadura] parvosata]|uniref:TetR family transcriptional regulator n=1 Tax=[Actinomadura] parvosata TaxID=1955412 RepID=UPI00406BEFF4
MPRWDPKAQERLRAAALELFVEQGYENTTVTQITERAGLTRRTFSRYFTDKRDVLFAGSEQLPDAVSAAVLRADATLPPFQALLAALADIGGLFAELVPHAAQRRAIIASSPDLQERERTKLAAVAEALAAALRERGATTSEAKLVAQVGVAVFQSAFERWTDQPERADFTACVHETVTELASSLAPAAALVTTPEPESS